MGWQIHSIDVTAAFLQGNELECEIFLRKPPDMCSKEFVWSLKHSIYGLNDASCEWYGRIRAEFKRLLGGVVSTYDKAMLLWHDDNGMLIGFLVSHVDDFAFAGSQNFHTTVIEESKKTFKIKQHENSLFRYVGLGFTQTIDGILVDQMEYIHQIKPIQIHKSRAFRKNDELTKEEKSQLHSFCAQMQWATTQTHPDLGFETCVMSNVDKHATVKDVDEANKALRKLQSKTIHLRFPNLGNPSKVQGVAYSDATYASLPDDSS